MNLGVAGFSFALASRSVLGGASTSDQKPKEVGLDDVACFAIISAVASGAVPGDGARNVALLYLFGSGGGQALCPLVTYLMDVGGVPGNILWRWSLGLDFTCPQGFIHGRK